MTHQIRTRSSIQPRFLGKVLAEYATRATYEERSSRPLVGARTNREMKSTNEQQIERRGRTS
jgi:hypothetical protein